MPASLRSLLCAVVLTVVLSGCASLDTSTTVDGGLRAGDLSALEGRYLAPTGPAWTHRQIGARCTPGPPIPDSSIVEVEALDARRLAFSIFDTDGAPRDEVILSGTVDDDGFFSARTNWNACTNPYILMILGWDVRRKKTYAGLTEDGDLVVGRAEGALLIAALVLPFSYGKTSDTQIYTRLDAAPDTTRSSL